MRTTRLGHFFVRGNNTNILDERDLILDKVV